MSVIVISAAIGLVLAGAILYLVRRDHLHGSYAVWWFAVAAAILVAAAFPRAIDWLGESLGVAYPPILAIIVGMGLILIRMLLMDVDRSRQERMLRRLTQRLAILDQELTETRGKLAVGESASAPRSSPCRSRPAKPESTAPCAFCTSANSSRRMRAGSSISAPTCAPRWPRAASMSRCSRMPRQANTAAAAFAPGIPM
jgi:hypothetical protein